MKVKESYTLEELCRGLSITLKKFCQMAGITEGTLINLRQGYSGRQSTINSILNTFSQIYGIEFSLENVTGITVQDKPHQKGKKQPEQKTTPYETSETKGPKNRNIEPKRAYTPRKTDLPDGCMLATDFAKQHGIAPTTFRDHMIIGLGPGVPWGMGNEMTAEKEHIDYSERDHPSRKGEKERYLTPEQQTAALDFWKRHDVPYQLPGEQKPAGDERPWYAPE